jgi:hypothetical protein
MKGSGATTSGGMVVVTAALLSCNSASRTIHRTATPATAREMKGRIGDRFICPSLPEIETLAARKAREI